jgi:hypothetical protein
MWRAVFSNFRDRGSKMAGSGVSSSRRGFLISVGSGGVAAAAAAFSVVTPQSKADNNPAEPKTSRGYQMSEHIENYYRTTRA